MHMSTLHFRATVFFSFKDFDGSNILRLDWSGRGRLLQYHNICVHWNSMSQSFYEHADLISFMHKSEAVLLYVCPQALTFYCAWILLKHTYRCWPGEISHFLIYYLFFLSYSGQNGGGQKMLTVLLYDNSSRKTIWCKPSIIIIDFLGNVNESSSLSIQYREASYLGGGYWQVVWNAAISYKFNGITVGL